MLKTKHKANSRRLKPGPFSLNQPTRTKAQVQLNRLGQQLKKKLRHGTPMDLVDSVTTEIGWIGLCILFLCVISVCYIIIIIIYSGNNEQTPNLHTMHNRVHPDHMSNQHDINSHLNDDGNSLDHALHVDPEHWPHHLTGSGSREQKEKEKQKEKERRLDADRFKADRRKKRKGEEARIPDDMDMDMDMDIDFDKLDPEIREKMMNEMGLHERNRHPKDSYNRNKRRRERKERKVRKDVVVEEKEIKKERENENESEVSNWERIWSVIGGIDISSSKESESSDILSEKSYRIKSAFLHAWHGYAKYALGHDEIHPVSDLPGDSWGGLGATLIDALDTMMIMGIKDEFKQARKKLNDIHFDIDLQVSFFETTIRHLGGLIASYEMSQILEPRDDFILTQAISLGDHLLAAFNTDKGIPKSMVNLKSGEIKNYGWTKDRSVLSEIGSNQLEFYALSEYTNDGKYYDKSALVYKLLNRAQHENIASGHGEFGLFSRLIDTDSATFPKNEKVYSLGGMSDSFYEYTLKLWILTNYNDKLAIKLYMESISAANEKLLRMIYDKKRREEAYFFYGEQWYTKFRGKMEELQCFMPGVLALGSYHAMLIWQESLSEESNRKLTKFEKQLISDREKHLKLAHFLLESCVSLYMEMPTGLAPETIEFSDDEWNAKEMRYQLRPETLESLFILYSLTGNQQYREWAWNIFESIEKHCKTDVAFSGIQDVTEIPAKQDNQMQSYVMAETFKYLFLIFDDYAASLLPLNQYVFNTEAHPIRIIKDITRFEWYKPNEMSNDNDNGNDNNNNNNDQRIENIS